MTPEQFQDFVYDNNKGKDYGMCAPPTEAQVAVDTLAVHFLGKNWSKDLRMLNIYKWNSEVVREIFYWHGCVNEIDVPSESEPQNALHLLHDILIPNWYCVLPQGVEQVNSEIVYQILKEYPAKEEKKHMVNPFKLISRKLKDIFCNKEE